MAFIRRAFQRGIAKRRLVSEKEIDRVKGALTLLEVGKQDSTRVGQSTCRYQRDVCHGEGL